MSQEPMTRETKPSNVVAGEVTTERRRSTVHPLSDLAVAVAKVVICVALVALVTPVTRARPIPHAMLVVALVWLGLMIGRSLGRLVSRGPLVCESAVDGALASWEDRLVVLTGALRSRGMEDLALALGRLLVAYRGYLPPRREDVDALAELEDLELGGGGSRPPLADLVALLVVLHDRDVHARTASEETP